MRRRFFGSGFGGGAAGIRTRLSCTLMRPLGTDLCGLSSFASTPRLNTWTTVAGSQSLPAGETQISMASFL